MRYRVLSPIPMSTRGIALTRVQRREKNSGREVFRKGEIVDVMNRHDVSRMLSRGIIGPLEYSFADAIYGTGGGVPAEQFAVTRRIGIFLQTSTWYSGGRIHMYQYALTLAQLGAEVFMITNAMPKWARDYPSCERLKILIYRQHRIPDDLDIVVTDSKADIGRASIEYLKHHPGVPFFAVNFETPNWVKKYVPSYASRLYQAKDVFSRADYVVANSRLSGVHCMEWLGRVGEPFGVIRPKVNTYALERSVDVKSHVKPAHPYAVYSARSADYKGGDLVIDAVWSLDIPFDLVAFGNDVPRPPRQDDHHRLFHLRGHGDAEKFALMRGARVVLAPSLFEGFGMVPAESLASGTPVICYDLPVLREEYGDVAGLRFVDWGDRAAFKRAVHEIAKAEEKPRVDSITVTERHGLESMRQEIEAVPYHCISRPRISVHMIAYWGFIPESITSIYAMPEVEEIIIAYGRVHKAHEIDDGSLDLIRAMPDPLGKIRLEVRGEWRNKLEMRNWISSQARGNRLLLLDGDEVWAGLREWIEAGHLRNSPRWVTFWRDRRHWVYDSASLAGQRWGYRIGDYGSECPHYRWSFWRPTYRFRRHPVPVDYSGHPIWMRTSDAAEETPATAIYHLGHALPTEVMRRKHEFYLARDGRDPARLARMRVWHDWDGRLGDCGDGIVARVDWHLPDIVECALDRLEVGSDANSIAWWERKAERYRARGDDRVRDAESIEAAKRCVGSVVEIGSAFGGFSSYLADDTEYTGIELAPSMVAEAREKFPGRRFIEGDIMAMDLDGLEADTVCAFQVLEHFADTGKFLARLCRIARERIVFSVPRGRPGPHQWAHDGHLAGWADEGDARESFSPFGRVEFWRGDERHICGVIHV